MLEVPTVGTHSWKRIQEETVALVGPMTLKKSLQIRNNKLSTSITVSGIHSHSKTSKYMIMYNLPSSRGTMTRTLTLQVTRSRQHDTSRPSVQPNHRDYVSMTVRANSHQIMIAIQSTSDGSTARQPHDIVDLLFLAA